MSYFSNWSQCIRSHQETPGNVSLKLKTGIMITTLTLSINLSLEHSGNGGEGRNLIVETDKLLKSYLGKLYNFT